MTTPSASPRSRELVRARPGPNPASRYLLVFALTIMAALLGGVGGLQLLKAAEHLPPPPINDWVCFDEKALFLKERAERDPTVVAVGSSVTWRNLEMGALRAAFGPHDRLLNGAPCYLYMHQTFFLTRYYVERFPNLHTVISVLAPRDFESCITQPESFFQPEMLDRFISGTLPEEAFYFMNFRIKSFLRNVIHIRAMRDSHDRYTGYNTMIMDAYGSGPIQVRPEEHRGTFYEEIRPDPHCATALAEMSRYLAERGKTLIVVLMPVMPAWQAAYDPDGSRTRDFAEIVRNSLAGTPALLIDGSDRLRMRDEDFVDAIHLQWSSVPSLMNFIVAELRTFGGAAARASRL